ncbi:MAG: UDP-N-acetylmuramoyl-L-alanyl-D-glutamate--2,6-diaminopimelate ligase [bacterium]
MFMPKIFPVTCHTDRVGPGSTYVAIAGFKQDGSVYVQDALKRGATTIVVQKSEQIFTQLGIESGQDCVIRDGVTYLVVDDARIALAELSRKTLGDPASKLKIIGITGTKGKSTTTWLIEHFLRAQGYKTALIGGIKNRILDEEEDSTLTTPSSDYLHMFFAECVKRGVSHVVMEVSAHALSLYRVHGLEFVAVGFTNLDPEHMDFYKNLDEYFDAKYLLFSQVQDGGTIVINRDNPRGSKASLKLSHNKSAALERKHDVLLGHVHEQVKEQTIISFGQKLQSNQELILFGVHDAHFLVEQDGISGLKFNLERALQVLSQVLSIETPKIFGIFNVYNISMAALICLNLGVQKEVLQEAIKNFTGVPGRLQVHILKNGARAFVDYAHNPSSMLAVLQVLRKLSKHLIVVFGCGGDRDKTKRPVMGALSAEIADVTIVTSDNPRTEDPTQIIQEILAGISLEQREHVVCEPDRYKAIELAVSRSHKDSVIALLGKGHEEKYVSQGKTIFFSDFQEISRF